jgi:hypothetical protein
VGAGRRLRPGALTAELEDPTGAPLSPGGPACVLGAPSQSWGDLCQPDFRDAEACP